MKSNNLVDQYATLIDARRVPDEVYQAEKSRQILETAKLQFEEDFQKMEAALSRHWNQQEITDAFYGCKNKFVK